TRRRSMSRRSSNQAIVEVLGRAELRFRSELDLASLDLDFIDRFRSRGRAPLHLASRHIETRSVQWTLHLVTIQSALVQLTTHMRTDVPDCIDLALHIRKENLLSP